jgi:glycosyltransferase involved in cell wall biosynthesis
MRIALVWNAPARLADISLRFDLYVQGFETLGHTAVTVCSSKAAQGYPCPSITCDDEKALAEPAFWRDLGADVALVLTWHRMGDVLAALRAAGTRTINIPDSDGCLGVRAHFWATLDRTIRYRPGWLAKANCLRYWLQCYLLGDARNAHAILESTRHSDVVLFASRYCKEAFRRFLDSCGQSVLDEKVKVMPLYPVPERFCTLPLPAEKANRVVAVGRWDDPQKDAGLLAAAIKLFLRGPSRTEFVLVGRNGEPWFADLSRRFSQVQYVGVQSHEQLAQLLATSRSVLFSSRWEGFPHTVNEALALGCTVLGTPIPSLQGVCEAGYYGRVSRGRRPADLAEMIREEMRAWDAGEREPQRIAAVWREQLRPALVCERLLREVTVNPGDLVEAGTTTP